MVPIKFRYFRVFLLSMRQGGHDDDPHTPTKARPKPLHLSSSGKKRLLEEIEGDNGEAEVSGIKTCRF